MSDNLPEVTKSFTDDLHIEEQAMCGCLPPEILLDIIIQLPIKSIITCTSVCKTWKSLIQNPTFIANHLHHSNNHNHNQPLFLFRLCSEKLAKKIRHIKRNKHEKELYTLNWDNNEDFNEHTRFDFPFHGQSCSGMVGTCNGLVLVCFDNDLLTYAYKLILWNPCLRKFVKLPEPNITYFTHSGFDASIGFGFDSKTNDYKVVRVVTLMDRDDWGDSAPRVEVCSLATKEWRITTALAPICALRGREQQAFVNGALHWVALRKTLHGRFCHFVLVFDLGDEVFREIVLPKLSDNGDEADVDEEEDEYWVKASISAYGNSLALIHPEDSGPHLNIWVMKEYAVASSWMKILKFAYQGQDDYVPRALGFRKIGEVLLEMHKGLLVSLDLESQQIKDLKITGYGYTFVGSFVESLVLLNKSNGAFAY